MGMHGYNGVYMGIFLGFTQVINSHAFQRKQKNTLA